MKKRYIVIGICVILCVFIFTRKTPEYYRDIVVVNNHEYKLEPHNYEEENPSSTTLHLDKTQELEIKVLDGGSYSVWIEKSQGLELISQDNEIIDKNPFRQIKAGETNALKVYKYKVIDESQFFLQMKNITTVESEEQKSYEDSKYFREIIFDFK